MRLALFLSLLLAAAPAGAQGARGLPGALDDLRLATAARLALVDDARTRLLDVEVAARDGVVAVSGIEDAGYQAVAAGLIRALPGVRAVQGLGLAPEASGDAPAPVAIPVREAPRVHVVQRGDTLYGIARRYGTTLDALVEINRLRSTDIRVGQRIRVR